jgi:hypothetical protein
VWLPSRISCKRGVSEGLDESRRATDLLEVVGNQCLWIELISALKIQEEMPYNCLRMVELHTSSKSALCKEAQL